ncbi:TIR domain-containing protein [Ulvibacter antarcticus]|uniref:TIR domain-containing protein n=1 Tax=Ulvibacter antarcticus TaxID=442714 RepID=A0A3L9Z1W4_9FLAO|nr:TIR domain-containing protein [Ulvibacter antarcticus]RMA64348.1 TIR domain-containing protein [Ulvibacter antarcticus]
MKYSAFISYSHDQDSKLAPFLEKGLEQFAKPTFKRRALNIFRDSNDLSASPNLWGKIVEALNESDYFIFLASPAAAQSIWCKKEVEHWMANKSMDNFLVVLTEGELEWEEASNDFNWGKTNALPKNLSGSLKNEPLYVDFRGEKKVAELHLDNASFQSKVVLLAATLHGKAVGDMVGEDVKQHRRTLRFRNSAIAVLTAFFIGAVILAFYAFQQKNIAVQEASKLKVSNYLSTAQFLYFTNKTEAFNVAFLGYRFSDSLEMENTEFSELLLKLLYDSSPMYIVDPDPELALQQRSIVKEVRELNGNSLVVNEESGFYDSVVFTKVSGELIPFNFYTPSEGIDFVSFSPKGKLIVIRDKAEISDTGEDIFTSHVNNAIYNMQGDLMAKSRGLFSRFVNYQSDVIVFDEDEDIILSLRNANYDDVIKADVFIKVRMDDERIISRESEHATAVAINKSGDEIAYGTEDGSIRLMKLRYGATQIAGDWTLSGHNGEAIIFLNFSEDQKYLVSESANFKRYWYLKESNKGILYPLVNQKSEVNPEKPSEKGTITAYADRYASSVNQRFEYVSENGDKIKFDTVHDLRRVNYSAFGKFYIGNSISILSPNSDYLLTQEGLFNTTNSLIIPIKFDPLARLGPYVSFSEDGRFLLVCNVMSTEDLEEFMIYLLDPDLILERMNTKPDVNGLVLKPQN